MLEVRTRGKEMAEESTIYGVAESQWTAKALTVPAEISGLNEDFKRILLRVLILAFNPEQNRMPF